MAAETYLNSAPTAPARGGNFVCQRLAQQGDRGLRVGVDRGEARREAGLRGEAYLWTALDELQKGNPIAWREAGVNARPRFGLALR